jgi:hypothetical protein
MTWFKWHKPFIIVTNLLLAMEEYLFIYSYSYWTSKGDTMQLGTTYYNDELGGM